MLLRRSDVALVDFAPARQAEANYTRPAVVVTNNQANAFSPVVIVVPLTSNIERVYPMQVFLPKDLTGLDRDSKAQIELIRHVNLDRVLKILSQVPEGLMTELDERLREHLAL